jgi:hypothetical protein
MGEEMSDYLCRWLVKPTSERHYRPLGDWIKVRASHQSVAARTFQAHHSTKHPKTKAPPAVLVVLMRGGRQVDWWGFKRFGDPICPSEPVQINRRPLKRLPSSA